jgi:RsiW-degrading membrane proteinase PrsW (M82 family)
MITFIEQYPYVLAFVLGIIPALVWLWFWLKEDRHPESPKMITLSFLGGMLAVFLVLPLQRIVCTYASCDSTTSNVSVPTFALLSAIEEIFKFGVVYFIALRNKKVTDEPVDDIIYLIISALGFVAIENALFLVDSIHIGDFVGTIITGNLRFVGASLLHIIASGTIGVFLALAFYKPRMQKILFATSGVILAIVLHTTFNLFIIQETAGNIFLVFGGVWLGIVLLLLAFEKVKGIEEPVQLKH